MRHPWCSALSAFLVCTALPSTGFAEPALWQRLDATPARAARAFERIEQLLDYADLADEDPDVAHNFRAGALSLFELSRVEPNPRQAYLIADAWLSQGTNHDREAKQLLERALSKLTPSSLAEKCWERLGLAEERLHEFANARRAYSRALELAWEPESRGILLLDRASVSMLSGALDAAQSDYALALETSKREDLVGLSHYGLAVALDRAGDWHGALQEAQLAVSEPLSEDLYAALDALDLPNVEFNPSSEQHYYLALRELGRAGKAEDAGSWQRALRAAAEQFQTYVGTRATRPAAADFSRAAQARLIWLKKWEARGFRQRQHSR